jgi:hypothetical protein
MGYGQSVSQFLASRAVVDSANAWNKAARKVTGSLMRLLRRELRSLPAVSRYLGFQAHKQLAEAKSFELTEDIQLTRGSGPRESTSPAPKPFECVCTDVKGKDMRDIWGKDNMVTFNCELSLWSMEHFCKQKVSC